MKSKIPGFLLFITLINMISCSKNSEGEIAEKTTTPENNYLNYTMGNGPFVYFGDTVFKKILLNNFNVNTNHDNEISFDEALAYNGSIDVSFKKIKSLVGIEKFENLVALDCSHNELLNVNFSKNKNLEYLDCSVNPFAEIDLEQNNKLKDLEITNTKITKLNLSKNPNLTRVVGECNYLLKSINIKNSNNANIGIFYFEMNNNSLECIQVDSVIFATTAIGWLKPVNVNYSIDCYDINNPK